MLQPLLQWLLMHRLRRRRLGELLGWKCFNMFDFFLILFISFWVRPIKPGWEMLGDAKNIQKLRFHSLWPMLQPLLQQLLMRRCARRRLGELLDWKCFNMFDFFLLLFESVQSNLVGRCWEMPKTSKIYQKFRFHSLRQMLLLQQPLKHRRARRRLGELLDWKCFNMFDFFLHLFESDQSNLVGRCWEMPKTSKHIGSTAYGRCWSRSCRGSWCAAARGGDLANCWL